MRELASKKASWGQARSKMVDRRTERFYTGKTSPTRESRRKASARKRKIREKWECDNLFCINKYFTIKIKFFYKKYLGNVEKN